MLDEYEIKGQLDKENVPSIKMITPEIQSIVKEKVDTGYAPAIAMATVGLNGEEYYEYGSLSYSELDPKVSRETIFEIGSITKTFTGVLLAHFVLAGKIQIDDSIAAYFPELENIEQIMVKHLVTHSSGLPSLPGNFIDSEMMQEDPWKNYSEHKLFTWLTSLNNEQLEFTPGSQFEYCNSGMGLLGCLLSKVAGKPYETLISEIILEPLQMTSTYFSSMPASQKERFAVPHFGEHDVPAWNFRASIGAAGGLRSTTQDLIKYIKAHLGYTHRNTSIGEALALSHTCIVLSKDNAELNTMRYGIGTQEISTRDGRLRRTCLQHGGTTGASQSNLLLDLAQKIGGIILCNSNYEPNINLLTGILFPEILPELELNNFPVVAADLNQSYFSALCGDYIQADSSITVNSKNRRLNVITRERKPGVGNFVSFNQETFYPTNIPGVFFSKSSDEKLGFRLEDDCVTLKTGDIVFEKGCSLKYDLKFSIYKDYLSCEKLWLRPMFPADYIYLTDCFMDPDSMRYWLKGVTYTLEGTQGAILRSAIRNISSPQTSGWSVITHDGIAGCFWAIKHESDPDADISYVVRRQFAGRGLTRAAGNLILDAKFSAADFNGKIIATVHPNNKASQHVLEKLGLQPDPERQNVSKYGSVRNYYQRVVKKEPPAILHDFYRPRKSRLTKCTISEPSSSQPSNGELSASIDQKSAKKESPANRFT